MGALHIRVGGFTNISLPSMLFASWSHLYQALALMALKIVWVHVASLSHIGFWFSISRSGIQSVPLQSF